MCVRIASFGVPRIHIYIVFTLSLRNKIRDFEAGVETVRDGREFLRMEMGGMGWFEGGDEGYVRSKGSE